MPCTDPQDEFKTPSQNKKFTKGWGYRSVVKSLCSIYEALGSNPATKNS